MATDDSPRPIAIYYVLLFASVGVSLPFMPAYLKSLGLSSTQVGSLLAIGPALSLVAPPLWGQLADRLGRPGLVLAIVSCGSAVCFSLLLAVDSYLAAFVAMTLAAVFSTTITTLIDTLALQSVASRGGSYARLRLFGSVGFVASSLTFGFTQDRITPMVLLMPLGATCLAALWSLTLVNRGQGSHQGPRPTAAAALELMRRPEIARFLAAACLHWVACAPYHGLLSIHVGALGLPPRVVSLSSSAGVISEIVVFATWPRWSHRFDPRTLLALSFAASALRWLGMSLTSSATVLVALALIHGLTFGAFFASSVGYMARAAPDSLRATGQAMFVAFAFGLGGLMGYVATGAAYDLLGGHRLFLVAAGLELLPMALMLRGVRNNPLPATVS